MWPSRNACCCNSAPNSSSISIFFLLALSSNWLTAVRSIAAKLEYRSALRLKSSASASVRRILYDDMRFSFFIKNELRVFSPRSVARLLLSAKSSKRRFCTHKSTPCFTSCTKVKNNLETTKSFGHFCSTLQFR